MDHQHFCKAQRKAEAAAVEVEDDTAGSAIIRCIVALSQAAADSHAAEAHKREEADIDRSQGNDLEDKASGSVDGGTVLARVSAQPGVDHASTDSRRGQALRPLLIPTEAYPPSGSASSPINVNMFHLPIDADEFDRKSPTSIHDSPLAHRGYDLNFFKSRSPTSTRSHLCDITDGPIAHAQLRLTIPIGNEMPPLCHSNGTTMRHNEVWGL